MQNDSQVLGFIALQFWCVNYSDLTPREEKIVDELIRHRLLTINPENVLDFPKQ